MSFEMTGAPIGSIRILVLFAALSFGVCQPSVAQDYDLAAPGSAQAAPVGGGVTLLQNVRIFDGKSAALSAPSNVLVKGHTIERISTAPIGNVGSGPRTIDGKGRAQMP